ncbi:MAG: hypothetical protein SVS85_01935, partial [Candidatus Nanohaloarchaea archaeon]|nr:hypothetical protein [Candidatus Nanohaloarchaea archaeon]
RVIKKVAEGGTWGGEPDMDDAMRYILNNVNENSYLFLISDFIGLDEGWENSLKMVSSKLNDVVGIMVRDIRDEELPEGAGRFRVEDPYSDNTIVLNLDKAKDDFEEIAEEQVEEVQEKFRRSDAGFVKVRTTDPFVNSLVQEMRLRKF